MTGEAHRLDGRSGLNGGCAGHPAFDSSPWVLEQERTGIDTSHEAADADAMTVDGVAVEAENIAERHGSRGRAVDAH
ncbi:MAG TPA: hypothetical protein VKT80_15575, partial [Chloroflexota bacterium]|nr:hypothetical protein [Chloroflexota bacterium]